MVEFCIERQHPAGFSAMIAAPDILDDVDIHTPPAVTAKRAVHIDAVCLFAPYPQMQQIYDVNDCEWEVPRIAVALTPLPAALRECVEALFPHTVHMPEGSRVQ